MMTIEINVLITPVASEQLLSFNIPSICTQSRATAFQEVRVDTYLK